MTVSVDIEDMTHKDAFGEPELIVLGSSASNIRLSDDPNNKHKQVILPASKYKYAEVKIAEVLKGKVMAAGADEKYDTELQEGIYRVSIMWSADSQSDTEWKYFIVGKISDVFPDQKKNSDLYVKWIEEDAQTKNNQA